MDYRSFARVESNIASSLERISGVWGFYTNAFGSSPPATFRAGGMVEAPSGVWIAWLFCWRSDSLCGLVCIVLLY